jgi:iron complex outermembrane recepter protein
MTKLTYLRAALAGSVSALVLATSAFASDYNIPGGDLKNALDSYAQQTAVALLYPEEAIKGVHTRGAKGDLSARDALSRILAGTGFVMRLHPDGAITIVHDEKKGSDASLPVVRLADAAPRPSLAAGIESVVVTSSKIKGDIQTVPIAITALSQEQLTSRQIAGGPDLVKEVPNLTFSKTNFTGYNIQIRGIGTQAISVTTDPAVAVALNDIPFIRNHFFEQEFYDVSQVEVLRGPQGTLYGRNATAGVVNVISAKPTDQFEAMASADIGNYHNRRFEGMINIPIVDDRADLRVAGEWTRRDGYSFNAITNAPIDGRDLWSGRVTLALKPTEKLQATLVWEHFSESDDRMRTAKQLCKTDNPPTSLSGQYGGYTFNNVPVGPGSFSVALSGNTGPLRLDSNYLSQGCLPTSLYAADAFEVPYGFMLPYMTAAGITDMINSQLDPYANTTQSRNLRVIESALNPQYRARNDTLELNTDYALTPSLTFTSQTGYNKDFLWSAEDYNRFNTAPGMFLMSDQPCPNPLSSGSCHIGNIGYFPDPSGLSYCGGNGCYGPDHLPPGAVCDPAVSGGSGTFDKNGCRRAAIFCDSQLGCSNRLVAEDLSDERAWQLSQEFRLSSNFTGPLNFSVGGNYLHYETEENYYVFINALSVFSHSGFGGGQNDGWTTVDNSACIGSEAGVGGWQNMNPAKGGGYPGFECLYIDPNPITSLNNEGHNYFLSQNPYGLNSYAGFGEVYYNIAADLKLTGGLRWTEDKKRFIDIPSQVTTQGYGYPVLRVVDQQWDELTGRAAANWMPKLDFTDQTLVYGSYAHGYKAGGANPPGAEFGAIGGTGQTVLTSPIHPLTFKPEFIDAYELGSKNTLLDGALTLNGDVFYYNYKNYQISRIVDRTSINDNFNATVKGAELETSWEPAPGLKFSFAGGYEDTRVANGQSSIDLMDRTAGMPGWMVVKPFATQASNCVLPVYVVAAALQEEVEELGASPSTQGSGAYDCEIAYARHFDPATDRLYQANPTGVTDPLQSISQGGDPIPAGYPGFNPATAPNNGEGFAKDLSGNELPNAPHFTTSLTAEYTLPVSEDWAATLHSDFYWQSQSWARIFNDRPYDKIRGYSNVNLALILTSASGWQVLGYLKNVFNTTAITGDFLNSDDTGLTTNVFLTDPRLFGVRVTKNF